LQKITKKTLKEYGEKIKRLEEENLKLRESKEIVEYLCDSHPKEKVTFYDYYS
jgi:uncharacterized protein (UPF0335 family)